MWALIVFPPIWLPAETKKPETCPFCSAPGYMIGVHQTDTRGIPAAVQGTSIYEHQYEFVRFRCRACRRTFSPPYPGASARWPDAAQMEFATLFCLGYTPEEIQPLLKEGSGFKVARSTMYRALSRSKQSNQMFELVKSHHQALRRRKRRAAASGRQHVTYLGRWERPAITFGNVKDLPPTQRFDYPNGTVIADAVSFSLRLFEMYGDRVALNALSWLDGFFEERSSDLPVAGRAKSFTLSQRSYQDFQRDTIARSLANGRPWLQVAWVSTALEDAMAKIRAAGR